MSESFDFDLTNYNPEDFKNTSVEFVFKNGVYRAYVVYRSHNKRLRVYTNCISDEKLSDKSKVILSTSSSSVTFKRNLIQYIVDEYVKEYNDLPHIEYVRNLLEKIKNHNKKKTDTILSFYDDFYSFKKITNDEVTMRRFKTLKKILNDFLSSKTDYKNFTYSQLSITFFEDFINFMLKEHKHYKSKIEVVGYSSSTAHKKLVDLRDYLKYCKVEQQVNIDLDRIDLHLRGLKKSKGVTLEFEPDHLALTLDEIRYSYKYLKSNEDKLSDLDVYYLSVFIFLCLQGLNPVDLKKLSKTNIKNGKLIGYRSKTEIEYQIPLNSVSLEILKKYDFNFKDFNEVDCNKQLKRIFRKIFSDFKKENPNFNDQFTTQEKKGKEIKEITGHISKFITLRTARYSFASNAIQMGLSPVDVQKMMGHKQFKTTQRYQHNLDKFKRDNVESIDIFTL